MKTISEALTEIYQKHGKCTPEMVIAAAKNPKSPLHGSIEWDAEKGLREYQLNQARRLLRIHPIYVEGQENPVQLVHVGSSAESGGYYPMTVVAANQDMFLVAREEILSHLNSLTASLNKLISTSEKASVKKTLGRARKSFDKGKELIAKI